MKAYKIAANPPDLATLAKEIEDLKKEDEEMEDVQEQKPKKAKSKAKSKEPKETSAPKRTSSRTSKKVDVFDPESDEEEQETKPVKTAAKRKSRETPGKAEETTKKKAKVESKKTKVKTPPPADDELSSASPAQYSSPVPTSHDLKEVITQRTKILKSIRHRLQRGFIIEKPTEESLPELSRYITRLEEIPDLEVSIMRATKIKKVLVAIAKIHEIPLEDTYKFKDRISKILAAWTRHEQQNPVQVGAAEVQAEEAESSVAPAAASVDVVAAAVAAVSESWFEKKLLCLILILFNWLDVLSVFMLKKK